MIIKVENKEITIERHQTNRKLCTLKIDTKSTATFPPQTVNMDRAETASVIAALKEEMPDKR